MGSSGFSQGCILHNVKDYPFCPEKIYSTTFPTTFSLLAIDFSFDLQPVVVRVAVAEDAHGQNHTLSIQQYQCHQAAAAAAAVVVVAAADVEVVDAEEAAVVVAKRYALNTQLCQRK